MSGGTIHKSQDQPRVSWSMRPRFSCFQRFHRHLSRYHVTDDRWGIKPESIRRFIERGVFYEREGYEGGDILQDVGEVSVTDLARSRQALSHTKESLSGR